VQQVSKFSYKELRAVKSNTNYSQFQTQTNYP